MKTSLKSLVVAAIFAAALTAFAQVPTGTASNGSSDGVEGSAPPVIVKSGPQKAATVQNNGVEFKVFAAAAPNTTHGSYPAHVNEIQNWLLAGANPATKPTSIRETLSINDLIVANDGSGRRTHFPVVLTITNGGSFKLHGFSWMVGSSDAAGALNYNSGFSGLNHDGTRIGINFGADNVPGGSSSDQSISSGPGDQPLHRLAFVGAGNAFAGNNADQVAGATTYYNNNRPFRLSVVYKVQLTGGGTAEAGYSISSAGNAMISWIRTGNQVSLTLTLTGDAAGTGAFHIQRATALKDGSLTEWTSTGLTINAGQTVSVPVPPTTNPPSGVNESVFWRAHQP